MGPEDAANGTVRRQGRERIWELDTDRLDEARRSLEQIEQQWDAALARLTQFVGVTI